MLRYDRQRDTNRLGSEKSAHTSIVFSDVYACSHSPGGGALAGVLGKLKTVNTVHSCLRVGISGINREDAPLCSGMGRTRGSPGITSR